MIRILLTYVMIENRLLLEKEDIKNIHNFMNNFLRLDTMSTNFRKILLYHMISSHFPGQVHDK